MKIKFIDLFAGIGGIRLGLENSAKRNKKLVECVFTSEWDKFANITYKENFNDNFNIAGDITKINESDIPEHNLLLAGFLCQAFSQAGKKRGFEDTRGTLFFDIARILQKKNQVIFYLKMLNNWLVTIRKTKKIKLVEL